MTTESIFPANRVIVVGMLDTMRVRDQQARHARTLVEVTKRALRTRGTGGRRAELAVQVRSPYGGMFAMKIALEPDVPGAELLDAAAAETLLAFEGMLQLKQRFDPRFARDTHDTRGRLDRGLPTRTLQLHVTGVREPSEQERRASSAVWLEGIVAAPPQISRHSELPAVQLAGTLVRVTAERPADFPGLGAALRETTEINVAVPTSDDCAAALYRAGNRVRIVGQLDCRMERQSGPSVVARLAELDTAWEVRKVELGARPAELRLAERAYRGQRSSLEESARLYVLALGVELIEGAPMQLEETYAARREWVREQRAQRATREARRAADQRRRAEAHNPAENS